MALGDSSNAISIFVILLPPSKKNFYYRSGSGSLDVAVA